MNTIVKYIKKVAIITFVDFIIVVAFCFFKNTLTLSGLSKGMLYVGITMFFFGVFALTGAGSATRGDWKSQYVRSAGGKSFNDMSLEFMSPSNKEASNTIALFISSFMCAAIWLILTNIFL